MAVEREKLSDLANEVRYVADIKDDLDNENVSDVPELTQEELDEIYEPINDQGEVSELDEETLSALGGGLKIGNIELPPPTMGVVALLDIIESPFVTGNASNISMRQVFEALYVLSKGFAAVAPLMNSVRIKRDFNTTLKIAEKSPEFYNVLLKNIIRTAESANEFDARVTEFAEEAGSFDITDAILKLDLWFRACMVGYAMLPKKKPDGVKKKGTIRRNGWLKIWRLFRRSPERTRNG